MRRRTILLFCVLLSVIVLTSCTAGPNHLTNTPDMDGTIAGFWRGLWHGIIIPISFVISLLSDHVRIYEVHNNGGWYNFGFLLGIGFAGFCTLLAAEI